MTAGQKLLVSIHNLERQTGRREFSEAEVAMQASLDWPHPFEAHSRHYDRLFPDSKRVSSELCKARRYKQVAWVRTSTYALTDLGRAIAAGARPCPASA